MWDLFLSHNSADKDFVRKLANDLSSSGIRVWLDEWELGVGDSLRENIEKGLTGSTFLAIVLSPNSVASRWVSVELNAAFAREIEQSRVVILPLLYRRCAIPAFLKDKIYADFTTSYERGLTALLRSIAQHTHDRGYLTRLPSLSSSENLQEILDRCASGLNSRVFLITTAHRFAASNSVPMLRFCTQANMVSSGCPQSDIDTLKRVGERTSLVYECQFRLLELAVPIMKDGQLLGALMAGQKRLREPDGSLRNLLLHLDEMAQLPNETFLSLYLEAELVGADTIERHIGVLAQSAERIAKEHEWEFIGQ